MKCPICSNEDKQDKEPSMDPEMIFWPSDDYICRCCGCKYMMDEGRVKSLSASFPLR